MISHRSSNLGSRLAIVLGIAGTLAATSCGVLNAAEPIDWSAQAEAGLLADEVGRDVVDCLLHLAEDDLERGPLGALATDELLRHCRSARAVTGGSANDTVPDSELAMTDVAWTRGDDPELDALWVGCEQGSGAACDELFERSPVGSIYEDYGVSCGDRPEVLNCAELDDPEMETATGP